MPGHWNDRRRRILRTLRRSPARRQRLPLYADIDREAPDRLHGNTGTRVADTLTPASNEPRDWATDAPPCANGDDFPTSRRTGL